MIVPMKKVSLIILGDKKTQALKKLRKLGLMHIEITEGSGEKLKELKEKITLLENAIFSIGKNKDSEEKNATVLEALSIADEIACLTEDKKTYKSEEIALSNELERLKNWGDIDPDEILYLSRKGTHVSLYEMPKKEYSSLGESVKTYCLSKDKASVKFLLIGLEADIDTEVIEALSSYRLELPKISTAQIKQKIDTLNNKIKEIDEKINSFAGYVKSIKSAINDCEKEIEFET